MSFQDAFLWQQREKKPTDEQNCSKTVPIAGNRRSLSLFLDFFIKKATENMPQSLKNSFTASCLRPNRWNAALYSTQKIFFSFFFCLGTAKRRGVPIQPFHIFPKKKKKKNSFEIRIIFCFLFSVFISYIHWIA